jgi:hypothetical protein
LYSRREVFERPEPGRHRHRVARQRAGLVDRPGRRDQVHDVGAAAVGADRQAAADDLAEAGQVRPHAEDRLRAAGRRAEARDHLVEDEQDAVASHSVRAAPARKPGAGGTTPMLPAIGSTMTAAIWRRRRLERARPTRGRCSARAACRRHRRRHAGARRHAERRRARSGLDEEGVGVAVIAPLELDDAVAPVARAPRGTALIAASVPELTKRTRSIEGMSARRARRAHFERVGAPKLVPLRAAAVSAFTSPLGAWPWMSGPHDIT